MKWYLLHPIGVHFPIVLLTVGLGVFCLSRWRGKPAWLAQASSWLLWLGTVAAWAAMGLGLLAEETAPHVPLAWEDLADHKTLAFWTVGSFTALSLWRWRFGERYPRAFLAGWVIAVAVLLATAYHGGELVYTWGMAVTAAGSN